ncbi:glycosyltransferase [Candidatus Woesearchaeota archaeon]|nr:glycosyltransferase [Candidatus Woesearchaeota archaeon]
MDAYDASIMLYNLSLIPVVFFSIIFFLMAVTRVAMRKNFEKHSKAVLKAKTLEKTPFVTVMIPVYNDLIALRCLKHCLKLDYPKNRYEIMVLDDSSKESIASALKAFSQKHGLIYIHRDNRQGYKPGALQVGMKKAKGEVIVIFDSDWIPPKNFLKKILKPMINDPKVAIVQARQDFLNMDKNIVSRFAGFLLMVFHSVMMPLYNKINAVFFCGTGGALKREAIEKVGGWNAKSLTEDADLSVKLLMQGYKTVYVPLKVKSEVPEKIEDFIKQQMRWTYGWVRVLCENFRKVWRSKKLSIAQKLAITFNGAASVGYPFVVLMTVFGMLGWFVGEPQPFKIKDLATFIARFSVSSGFLIAGFVTLKNEGKVKEFGKLALSTIVMGLVLAVFNSLAVVLAFANKKLLWYRTPKVGDKYAKQYVKQ